MIFKKTLAGVMTVIILSYFAVPASAEVTLDEVLKRLQKVEEENAVLKAELTVLKDKQVAAQVKVDAQDEALAKAQAEMREAKAAVAVAPVPAAPVVPAPAAPSGNFVKTKLDVDLYGQVRADSVYSDSEGAAASNAYSSLTVQFAPRQTNAKRQSSFNVSAQETRLGFNIKAPDINEGKLSGKIETDFAGGTTNGGSGNYTPRLRLAYAQLDYPKWAVSAGQNWDFFAPINPNLVNPGGLWRAGNLGHRHPQGYLTNKWGEVLGGTLTTKVGVIDSDDPYQENSGMPVYGVYAGYDTKILKTPTTFGVGAIYGKNSTSLLNNRGPKNNNIYATTAGMTLKFTDWLAFKTEGFTGAKLDDFYGGSSTGITNTATVANSKAVRDVGGFMELTYNPIKKVETNFGLGLDNPVNAADTVAAADRANIWRSNRTYYTNLKYSLSKDILLGLEFQHFNTNWLDGVKSSSNRVDTSVLYKF